MAEEANFDSEILNERRSSHAKAVSWKNYNGLQLFGVAAGVAVLSFVLKSGDVSGKVQQTADPQELNGVRGQMSKFWEEHSTRADLTEMMLDSNAEKISVMESEEILAAVPDYAGKDILELGAGIGRFTEKLSESAKSLIAVDFMKNFVDKNKEINAHRKNVQFLCKNVMDLQIPDNSLDLIFSNWLLMYLSDKDIEILIQRMLKWLRPNGRLFFRESCFRQSGDKARSHNPTIYRSPSWYTNLITGHEEKKEDGKLYGFNVIASKSVQVYITLKNNPNQICWLMEMSERNSEKSQGYETFQKFLDHKQYSRNGILRYEEMFGKDYVSTGGHGTTKEFCKMLRLKKGEKVLDVGCGIGGSAFHMAKEYGAEVLGIDLSENMIEIAIERQADYKVPKVSFEVADATKIFYPDQSFDVIYSRDTILHIERKDLLFKSFYKWLKPGGRVLITDYVCGPHENHSEDFKAYVAQRGYHLLTVQQYGKVLEDSGFINVQAIDKTNPFVNILKDELAAFGEKKGDFLKKFSLDDFNAINEGWNDKLKRCAKGDQKWGLFYAEKS